MNIGQAFKMAWRSICGKKGRSALTILSIFIGIAAVMTIVSTMEGMKAKTMEQFAASINEFLAFRRYDILPDKGHISQAQAQQKAFAEYDVFNRTQRIDSDFDKQIKQLTEQQ